jgi:hypothetical protein
MRRMEHEDLFWKNHTLEDCASVISIYNWGMTNLPEKPTEEKKTNYMVIGIAAGIAIGAGIGVAMNNIAIGIGIGVALGVAIGAGMEEQHKKKTQ